MQTEYNRQQRRNRLHREIVHYSAQLEKYVDRATPQSKRNYTLAARCLKRRCADLLLLL